MTASKPGKDPRALGFDANFYRATYADLARMSEEVALAHFLNHGFGEHRLPNAASTKLSMLSLVPTDQPALEIGPWGSPQLHGPLVRYADFFSTEELRAKAPANGFDPAKCPPIHYVLSRMTLHQIEERFASVFSSHCIEHQPDLVDHLQGVGRLLDEGCRYFLTIPDKRYCFDHFLSESTIADVLVAHEERRTRHSLRSVIASCALTTHNDPVRHWEGDHGQRACDVRSEAIIGGMRHHRAAAERGEYIDCHAWQFTPESFQDICGQLHAVGLSAMKPVLTCATPYGLFEFCAILAKDSTRQGHPGTKTSSG